MSDMADIIFDVGAHPWGWIFIYSDCLSIAWKSLLPMQPYHF